MSAIDERRCVKCNKVLAAEQEGDLCSLCAIGLIPAEEPSTDIGEEIEQQHIVVEGRALSGVHCPECGAELSGADLNQYSCAICGAVLTPERVNRLIHRADAKTPRIVGSQTGSPSTRSSLPKDAPLW
jgi:hypothetical protein